MTLLALYIPKLAGGSVELRLLLVALVAVALVAYSRRRWGILVSAGFVVVGWLVAVMPVVVDALSQNLDRYGDLCREVNPSTLPDWFFAVYAYFDVGWGTIASLAGLVGGWVVLECAGQFRRWVRAAGGAQCGRR